MASKNNLQPKKNFKNNIDKWSHLTGKELPLNEYTRDQIRALAATYSIKNYSSFTQPQLIEKLKVIFEKEAQTFKTLFESIKEKAEGEAHSLSWYITTLRSLSTKFKTDPEKIIRQELLDSLDREEYHDENLRAKRTYQGHLIFFEYKAETKSLPYYDKFPLVYVLKVSNKYFYGANLHYLEPKKRLKVMQKLLSGRVDIPKKIIHKYLNVRCESYFLDLAKYEWESAILLPIENFVLMRGGGKIPYDKELVWEEMKQYYDDRITGDRMVKGKSNADVRRVK